jgi:hypothetical protein
VDGRVESEGRLEDVVSELVLEGPGVDWDVFEAVVD